MWLLHKNRPIVQERLKHKQLNVVITGGSKGLGKSLAKEFESFGDHVTVLSRSSGYNGFSCDVSNKTQLQHTINKVGKPIDIWINNAAQSGGYNLLEDTSIEKIEEIILTNLVATCVASKIVYEIMKNQPSGGAIYNIAGAGSNGFATPNFAIYGATKAGITQFTKSFRSEINEKVNINMVSPGMMMTDLLIENLDLAILEKIEPFISNPEVVGKNLASKIRNSYYNAETCRIDYLTLETVLEKLVRKL